MFENMPTALKNMYKLIGNPNIEYYFGDWILMSLVNVQERSEVMENPNVVDFAIRYAGMGHVVVCSYDPRDGKIFFRRDGGSNGYERNDRWNFIKSYQPESDKKRDIGEWFDRIDSDYAGQPWKILQDPLLINP